MRVLQAGLASIYPRALAKAGKLGLKPRAKPRIWTIPLRLLITLLDTWLPDAGFSVQLYLPSIKGFCACKTRGNKNAQSMHSVQSQEVRCCYGIKKLL